MERVSASTLRLIGYLVSGELIVLRRDASNFQYSVYVGTGEAPLDDMFVNNSDTEVYASGPFGLLESARHSVYDLSNTKRLLAVTPEVSGRLTYTYDGTIVLPLPVAHFRCYLNNGRLVINRQPREIKYSGKLKVGIKTTYIFITGAIQPGNIDWRMSAEIFAATSESASACRLRVTDIELLSRGSFALTTQRGVLTFRSDPGGLLRKESLDVDWDGTRLTDGTTTRTIIDDSRGVILP